MLLLLILALQGDPRALVEKLRSDRVEERDEAIRGLKALGKAAVPELEKAARDPDAETAARARLLLRSLDIAARLSPGLRKTLPGVEDRLAASDTAWVEAFLKSSDPGDIAFLVAPAVRASRNTEERRAICDVFFGHRVYGSVGELAPILRDKEAGGKIRAVMRMIRAHEAVPAFAALLRDPDPRVRLDVLVLLNETCTPESAAAMLPALDDADPEIRHAAILYLSYSKVRTAIPGILRLLKEDSFSAAPALARLDAREAIPAIVATLKDPAAWHLVPSVLRDMDAQEAIPLLAKLLDEAPDSRPRALAALAALGARSEEARIKRCLSDADPSAKSAATDALRDLRVIDALPAIRKELQDADEAVRGAAARAVAELDPAGAPALLLPLLEDKDLFVRESAVKALARLRTREAAPAFEKALSSEERDVRIAALQALVALGRKEALPGIRALLKDEDGEVQAEAALALARLGPPGDVTEIAPLLKDPECAPGVLGEFVRRGAGRAVAALLKSDDENLREWAAAALKSHGTRDLAPAIPPENVELLAALGARDVIPAIRKRLEDPEPEIRAAAARALAEFGTDDALPALQANLRQIHVMYVLASIDSMARLGRREAVSTLHPLTEDSTLEVREKAVWALGRLGAPDSAPRLAAALDDRFNEIRAAAAEALGRMGGHTEKLRGLVGHPYIPLRRAAAEALCRQGLREGAAEAMRHASGLTPLNALRRPGVWKRLAASALQVPLEGTRKEVLSEIARRAGLAFAPTDDPSMDVRLRVRARTLLDALEEAVDPAIHVVVLEDDRLTLDGGDLWREWWREERKRP